MACAADAVVWQEISYSAPPWPAGIPLGRVSPGGGACPSSVRAVRAGKSLFAAWWQARDDSSSELLVARSLDGGRSWTNPVAADTTDHSVTGCGRPPPAIAADEATGNMHVAYFAEPRGRSGIFVAHSMDVGRTFHAPVPIVFGETPAFVSVAAERDRVAVAYEDPNSAQPTVGIALSRTMGHIFERREVVSGENERARQPAVELRGDTVRIWWSDHSPDPRISATRAAYRAGYWR